MAKNITEITRRDLFDLLNFGFEETYEVPTSHPDFKNYCETKTEEVLVPFWGRLDEISFLKRLYNLNELPSLDPRFRDALGDIWQHTVLNDDYELGWVFEDQRFLLSYGNEDEYLLNFLSEMFHPVVRDDKTNWKLLLERVNNLLEPDGYKIYPTRQISGRNIYGWKHLLPKNQVVDGQIDNIVSSFDTQYVQVQVDLMYSVIESAPNAAIGKAKDLLEMCCKTILDEQKIEYKTSLDLIQLQREACKSIGLHPDRLEDGIAAEDIAARILANLTNIAQGMAELRNHYGDGHGKNRNFQSLPPRYAHLAVGASVAAVHFMWDTFQEQNS